MQQEVVDGQGAVEVSREVQSAQGLEALAQGVRETDVVGLVVPRTVVQLLAIDGIL